MSESPIKRFLFASDFDRTLSFNDSGYVLSELLGIPTAEFERKAAGMAKLNLVQQGAELAYLLLHDPQFRSRVRREHLYQVGKRIRLKQNIALLYEILDHGIEGYHFDFYVLSAAPTEVIQSALEGIVPADHIYGTDFRYTGSGEIEALVRATAGYGKVAVLDQLQASLQIGPDHIVYVGDGSSDVHVMLHVKVRDGFTIAVSETKHVSQIASRTVLSDNAISVLVPILEKIVGLERPQIRRFFESHGLLVQGWEKVRTDWVTFRAISA
ncbi:MAG TPA: haloacid dehalogenase-like hydrolase [Candidatus Acidoferrales bacterium]|nr:haloacid dehalogenase-like hydrolase [Candidatus Acidoferrales bacterium]